MGSEQTNPLATILTVDDLYRQLPTVMAYVTRVPFLPYFRGCAVVSGEWFKDLDHMQGRKEGTPNTVFATSACYMPSLHTIVISEQDDAKLRATLAMGSISAGIHRTGGFASLRHLMHEATEAMFVCNTRSHQKSEGMFAAREAARELLAEFLTCAIVYGFGGGPYLHLVEGKSAYPTRVLEPIIRLAAAVPDRDDPPWSAEPGELFRELWTVQREAFLHELVVFNSQCGGRNNAFQFLAGRILIHYGLWSTGRGNVDAMEQIAKALMAPFVQIEQLHRRALLESCEVVGFDHWIRMAEAWGNNAVFEVKQVLARRRNAIGNTFDPHQAEHSLQYMEELSISHEESRTCGSFEQVIIDAQLGLYGEDPQAALDTIYSGLGHCARVHTPLLIEALQIGRTAADSCLQHGLASDSVSRRRNLQHSQRWMELMVKALGKIVEPCGHESRNLESLG